MKAKSGYTRFHTVLDKTATRVEGYVHDHRAGLPLHLHLGRWRPPGGFDLDQLLVLLTHESLHIVVETVESARASIALDRRAFSRTMDAITAAPVWDLPPVLPPLIPAPVLDAAGFPEPDP